jgi:curli biogenesis system outer membrane secretion channel CsgG
MNRESKFSNTLLSRQFMSFVILIVFTFNTSLIFAVEKPQIGVGDIVVMGDVPGQAGIDFAAMLTTALVKTRKFSVIERARLKEIFKEQGISTLSGAIDGGVKLGGISGVGYLVYGSITQFGKSSEGVSLQGLSIGGGSMTMGVDIKLVDAQTGRTLVADAVTHESQSSQNVSIAGLSTQSASDDTTAGDLMRATATDVANLITTSIFPMKVVVVQKDGTVILNYGDGALEEGMVLEVYEVGEGFKDPDTGEVLGAEETLVATIEVTQTTTKFSKAMAIDDSDVTAITKGSIARIVDGGPDRKKKTEGLFGIGSGDSTPSTGEKISNM